MVIKLYVLTVHQLYFESQNIAVLTSSSTSAVIKFLSEIGITHLKSILIIKGAIRDELEMENSGLGDKLDENRLKIASMVMSTVTFLNILVLV